MQSGGGLRGPGPGVLLLGCEGGFGAGVGGVVVDAGVVVEGGGDPRGVAWRCGCGRVRRRREGGGDQRRGWTVAGGCGW